MTGKDKLCKLCQTPIADRAGATDIFCCAGCEKVYDVLSRLDDSAKNAYVETARKLGIIPSTPEESPIEPEKEGAPIAAKTERMQMDGLVCPSCGWVAGEVLTAHKGVQRATVDYFTGTAEITYDLAATSEDDLDNLLRPLGYRLKAIGHEGRSSLSKRNTFEFLVVAILAMNVMSLSFLRYFHTLGHLDHIPVYIPWIEGALTVPILYLGWIPALKRAVAALRFKRMTMDLLIAIGVGAAALLSAFSLMTGREDMYFETASGLVAITLLSRMIEARLRQRAFSDLTSLMKMPVTRMRKIVDSGHEDYVAVADVAAGDHVRFLQGESIPVDGEVLENRALVSEAVLTGEPKPLSKGMGDQVVAGSTVMEGTLDIKVIRRFDETLLSQIASSIGETLSKQEGRLQQADRIAAWFIPAVVTIAVSAFVARWILYGAAYALTPEGWFPSIAVLAVACPCAFSLAGISAITAATGALLKKGFLVKELTALDALPRITKVIFDKTGTVTKGAMTVEQLVWKKGADPGMLSALLAAEHKAVHPAASAIRDYLVDKDLDQFGERTQPEIEERQGQGRIAAFADKTLAVGSASLFDNPFQPEALSPNHTAVWFGWNREAKGCFLLTDEIRKEAKQAIDALGALGLKTALISGDRDAVTQYVANAVGIGEAKGDAAIDDKIAKVKECKAKGEHILFVGDGTNDALAMSESDTSVALAKSTDEALHASGFVSLKGELTALASLIAQGQKLKQVITQNYLWAFSFNTLFIPVAAAGKLVPLAAMLLMLMSSIAVLLNATRLKN